MLPKIKNKHFENKKNFLNWKFLRIEVNSLYYNLNIVN